MIIFFSIFSVKCTRLLCRNQISLILNFANKRLHFFGGFRQENTRNVIKCPFANFCFITFDKNSVCVSVERGKVGFIGRAFKT